MDKYISRLKAVIAVLVALGYDTASSCPDQIKADLQPVGAELMHAEVLIASGQQPNPGLIKELDESITKLEVDVDQLKSDDVAEQTLGN